MEAVQSLDQCRLQVSQEDRWLQVLVPVLIVSQPVPAARQAERLLTDASRQQQAVEVLPVQELVHVLQEESLTEPAEFRGCVLLHTHRSVQSH